MASRGHALCRTASCVPWWAATRFMARIPASTSSHGQSRSLAAPAIQDQQEDHSVPRNFIPPQQQADDAGSASSSSRDQRSSKGKAAKKPRRTKKQLATLEKMQRLAQQIRAEQQQDSFLSSEELQVADGALGEPLRDAESEATTGPSSSSVTFVEPSSSAGGPSEPTLETLKSYQPKRAPNLWSERYPKQYQRVFGRVDNALIKEQVARLANELFEHEQADEKSRNAMDSDLLQYAQVSDEVESLRRFSKATLASPSSTPGFLRASLAPINAKKHSKRHIIERVLDVWGWKKPEVIAREKKRRELQHQVESRNYPVTEAEAYLIFKRDRAFVRDLVSRQGFELSIVNKPRLAIKATAKVQALEHLDKVLGDKRKSLHSELFTLKTPDPKTRTLLSTISDKSGAFIESASGSSGSGGGHYRIHYSHRNERSRAVALLERADWSLSIEPQQTNLVAAYRTQTEWALGLPQDFALYPHSSPGDAAWWLDGQDLFRLRRVGSWFGSVSRLHTGGQDGLGEMHVDIVRSSERESPGDLSTLGKVLKQDFKDEGELGLEIDFGHVLQSIRRSDSSRASLVPPEAALEGKYLDWLKRNTMSNARSIFVPLDRPFARVLDTEGARIRRYRSVCYRGDDGTRLRLRTDLAASSDSEPNGDLAMDTTAEWKKVQQTDCLMPDHSVDLRLSHTRSTRIDSAELPEDFRTALKRGGTMPASGQIRGQDMHLLIDQHVTEIEKESNGVKLCWRRSEDPDVPSRLTLSTTPDRVEELLNQCSSLIA